MDRIVRNRVYTGDLVQGQNGNISYKVQKTRRRPETLWYIKENAHEALVSREDFVKAQQLMGTPARAQRGGTLHPLAGLVRCAQCGRALARRRVVQANKTYEYYICPTYRQCKSACSKHSIRVEVVEQAVLEAIRDEIRASVDFARVSRDLAGMKNRRAQDETALRDKLSRVMELKRGIYGDWKSGELTREEYLSFKSGYDAQEEQLRARLRDLPTPQQSEEGFARLRSLALPDRLERGLAAALIREVLVEEDGRMEIHFNFQRPVEIGKNS